MNITVTDDGRYEGEIRSDQDTTSFSGKLELLAVLEDLLHRPGGREQADPPSPERR